MLCSLESKLVFDSTGVRSTKPQRTSPVASDGMGQTKNNNIISREYHVAVSLEFDGMGCDKQPTITSSARRMTWTYHAAVSVEFDRDGMGQTNNNNIVSGEYHAAVSVEFDGNGMGQTNN